MKNTFLGAIGLSRKNALYSLKYSFVQEKNYKEIFQVLREIEKFADTPEHYREKEFGFLLEFNAFAFNKIDALDITGDTKKRMIAYTQEIRIKLENSIREDIERNKKTSSLKIWFWDKIFQIITRKNWQ